MSPFFRQRTSGSVKHPISRALGAVVLAIVLVGLHGRAAVAQEGLQSGEAFLTRFAGTIEQDGRSVIDANGTVGSVIDIRSPGEPPRGARWANEPQRMLVTAAQVGQVFGVAIDDATPPNVYLTATSAFGLHRNLDNSGWMAGMWGAGGGPGAVWMLNAANNYQPEPFAEITLDGRTNTGAALGNIAFDRWNQQLYVSDLETGMIHRLRASDGLDLGRYDHGTSGRSNFLDAATGTTQSFPPVAFDPATSVHVNDCPSGDFARTPSCWNFADFRRRVWGLGVRQDPLTGEVRLYYATWGSQGFGSADYATSGDDRRNAVWSVAIDGNGDFDVTAVRREFLLPDFFRSPEAIARAGFSNPVSDIAFTAYGNQDVMLLAERGGVRNLGLAADNAFAYPHESRVLRYQLDAQGMWQPAGRYDVGSYDRAEDGPPYVRAGSAGGVSFGFDYDETGAVAIDRPDAFVWMSGDSLCSERGPCLDPTTNELADASQVDGIQGRPAEPYEEIAPEAAFQPYPAPGPATPATGIGLSYMINAGADLASNDATRIGDVEVFEPAPGYGVSPELQPAEGPWYGPWEEPWPWPVPEEYPPFDGAIGPELALAKSAPPECERGGDCVYTVTVISNGPEAYDGPLYLLDTPPAGATYVGASAGWVCEQRPPGGIGCRHDPVFLVPGDSVDLTLTVTLPPDIPAHVEQVWNCGFIVWPRALAGPAQVRAVEAALLLNGYDPGPVDGIADAATQAAIDDYRLAMGLPPGGIDEVLLTSLFPGSSGLAGDGVPGNDWACASTQVVQPALDLAIEKTGPAECERDGECTFEVTVTNNGTEAYDGDLVFTEALSTPDPGGAIFVPELVGSVGAGWICTEQPAGVTCRHPGASLAPGASETVQITWRIPADYEDDLARNCASLLWLEMGHEPDPISANDTACSETAIALPEFDLAVAKTGPAYCSEGSECTFEVTVTNHSTEPYDGDLVFAEALSTPAPGLDIIPPDLVGFTGAGWNCLANPVGVTCRHPGASLAAGASETVTITLLIPEDYEPNSVRNCASLAWLDMGHAPDPIPGNDSACSETPVGIFLHIIFELVISGASECERGALCEAHVIVRNAGSEPFDGEIGLRGYLTPGLPIRSVSGTTSAWSCQVAGSRYECAPKRLSLKSGASERLTLSLMIPADFGPDSIRHDMSLVWPDETKRDPQPETDEDFSIIRIVGPPPAPEATPRKLPDLAVTKSAQTRSCDSGQPCGFSVKVANVGDGPFSGTLTLTDAISPSATRVSSAGSSGWSCSGDGAAVTCSRPNTTLAPGASTVLNLSFTMPRSNAGTVENCATLAWGGAGGVLAVQQALAARGFNPGPLDGLMGRSTSSAIRAYQQANRLAVTGRIDAELTASLFAGAGDANASNDGDCATATLTAAEIPPAVLPAPECDPGWRQVSSDTARSLAARGAPVRRVTNGRRTIWCTRGVPPPAVQPQPEPPPLTCPPGYTAYRDKNSIPAGSDVVRRQSGSRVLFCAKPKPLTCPPGYTAYTVRSRVPKGAEVVTRQSGNQVLYCAKPRPAPQARCPAGWSQVSRTKAKALVQQGYQIQQVGDILCARPGQQTKPQRPAPQRITPQVITPRVPLQ